MPDLVCGDFDSITKIPTTIEVINTPDQNFTDFEKALKKEKGKTGGDLMTRKKYDFFELQLDWNLPKPGNSGIIFRVAETDGPAYKTGPEMQIFHQMKPGGKTDTGSCYALYAPKVASMNKIGEWNKVRLIVKPGNLVEHHLNGKLLCAYEMGGKPVHSSLRI